MDDGRELGPVAIFTMAFVISALSGLAAVLRSSKPLTGRLICSALLNNGACGVATAMLLFHLLSGKTWYLLGICVLTNLGGLTWFGVVMYFIRRGGVRLDIRLTPREKTMEGEFDDKGS